MQNCSNQVEADSRTLTGCFQALLKHPFELLILRWNWKSAIFSSLCRGAVFFLTNIRTGLSVASGAMLAEFAYRALTAGFYGAITQAFRSAEPKRKVTILVVGGLTIVSHAIEFCVHWLRGTPNLRTSIVASAVFTIWSTLFNLHATRQGVLVSQTGGRSLIADLKSLPKTLGSFFQSCAGLRMGNNL